jgi:hypothetical protein
MTTMTPSRRNVIELWADALQLRPALVLGLLMGMTGCAGTESPPAAKTEQTAPAVPTSPAVDKPQSTDFAPTHAVVSETEYYTTGPQQGRPADGSLPAGTNVELLESSGSYSLVRAESGTEGYVSQSALKALDQSAGTAAEPESP